MCTRVLQNGVQKMDSPERLLPLIVGAALGRHSLRHMIWVRLVTSSGLGLRSSWFPGKTLTYVAFTNGWGRVQASLQRERIKKWCLFWPPISQNIKYFVVQMQ